MLWGAFVEFLDHLWLFFYVSFLRLEMENEE